MRTRLAAVWLASAALLPGCSSDDRSPDCPTTSAVVTLAPSSTGGELSISGPAEVDEDRYRQEQSGGSTTTPGTAPTTEPASDGSDPAPAC